MLRFCLASLMLSVVVSLAGCVGGPMCGSCDGCGEFGYDRPIPYGPVEGFRAWRKSVACGAGCGGVYVDEWASNPPDCVDPCPDFACGGPVGPVCGCRVGPCSCGDPCAGCCNVCTRLSPIRAVARVAVALYGKRHCEGCGYEFDDCCCDEAFVDGSCDTGCAGCASGQCQVNGDGRLARSPHSTAVQSQANPQPTVRAPAVKQATRIPARSRMLRGRR